MKIGYARTSTVEQEAGLADQKRELEKAGAERVYAEHVSAVAKSRPQFDVVMAMLREGDVLIVTKLDRLARSMADLMDIIKRIKEAGASLRVLALGLDTSTATGELMLNVLGSVAQFERSLMLERQRVGIAKAKAEGKYKGSKRTFSDERIAALHAKGMGVSAMARELGVSREAIYKRRRQSRAA